MKTAIIYARVSSSIERNRQSTDRQVLDLQHYAMSMGYEVRSVFEEYISGGKQNQDRVVLRTAMEYAIENNIDICLCSELSRIGRSAFDVLQTVKAFVDYKINLYLQKEHFLLLDDEGKPSVFAPIMLATLSTCAQIERESIQFRLKSGYDNFRAQHQGEKVVGRRKGSTMSREEVIRKHEDIIGYLKKGMSIRDVAKITGKGISTVQRVKKICERI